MQLCQCLQNKTWLLEFKNRKSEVKSRDSSAAIQQSESEAGSANSDVETLKLEQKVGSWKSFVT